FFIEVTQPVTRVDGNLPLEATRIPGTHELTVATFNVENLDTTDPQSKFDRLAGLIVNNLRAPDLIAVEEIQDNNGPTDDGTVDASATIGRLESAIQAAGGPAYTSREIDPVNDQDGGEPGGNIRQIFLFRTDRGLEFVDRPGGGSTTATTVVSGGRGPERSLRRSAAARALQLRVRGQLPDARPHPRERLAHVVGRVRRRPCQRGVRGSGERPRPFGHIRHAHRQRGADDQRRSDDEPERERLVPVSGDRPLHLRGQFGKRDLPG